jgi:hypothetical protein
MTGMSARAELGGRSRGGSDALNPALCRVEDKGDRAGAMDPRMARIGGGAGDDDEGLGALARRGWIHGWDRRGAGFMAETRGVR